VLLGSHQEAQVRAALVRGFFILLMIMAGQFVILGTPGATAIPKSCVISLEMYTNACLQHFFRLAAFASLLSLFVGLQPGFIWVLLDLVRKGLANGDRAHPEAS
jgi:hypothetical protein